MHKLAGAIYVVPRIRPGTTYMPTGKTKQLIYLGIFPVRVHVKKYELSLSLKTLALPTG